MAVINASRTTPNREEIMSAGLHFEPLEERRLMSVSENLTSLRSSLADPDDNNVTAVVNRRGDLVITGNGAANHIAIDQDGLRPDQFRISSADGSTTINGRSNPVVFARVRDDVHVSLRGGDDVLELSRINVRGDLRINMGAGTDHVISNDLSDSADLELLRGSAEIIDLAGSLHGAAFRARVPENWNGTLLVFAHGYGDIQDPVLIAPWVPYGEPPNQLEANLLEAGYALAGSAFRGAGWQVEEAIPDTAALTRFIERNVIRPEHTILWGESMGSVVVLQGIERFPQLYDAAIPLCVVGAGTSRTLDDIFIDFGLAYDVALGFPESWGSLESLRNDLSFDNDVFPVLADQMSDPAAFGQLEFVRLVTRRPLVSFYESPDGFPALLQNMFLATDVRLELEQRAGGPIAQNVGHVYTLTTEEKDYLASLGVDADSLLAEMNDRLKIEAPHSSRRYVERFADYTGRITRPVLTVHTIGDGTLPTYHGTAYRELVESVGRGDLLAQVYTNGGSHCLWEPAQLQATAEAMVAWLETGIRPGDEAFPVELGFVLEFEPGPFPQPDMEASRKTLTSGNFLLADGEGAPTFGATQRVRTAGAFHGTNDGIEEDLMISLHATDRDKLEDAVDHAFANADRDSNDFGVGSSREWEWNPDLLAELALAWLTS
jgi:pimeloyl-ACP methyl ester carboxylesterase